MSNINTNNFVAINKFKIKTSKHHIDYIFECSNLFNELKQLCKLALLENHLTKLCFYMLNEYKTSLEMQKELGIPVDLLRFFPNWENGSNKGFNAEKTGYKLTPSGVSKLIPALRLQLSPSSHTVPIALKLIRDLINTLDPKTHLYIVAEPNAHISNLEKLIFEFNHINKNTNIHFAELPSITVFAQDNARAVIDNNGNPILLLPRSFSDNKSRKLDEIYEEQAVKELGRTVYQSSLYFEGGNIVYDDNYCMIGVDTITENICRLGLTKQEVIDIFEAEFGKKIIPIGNFSESKFSISKYGIKKSGQPSFHIDLDISLLGKYSKKKLPRAIIADPSRGLDFLDEVLKINGLFSDSYLPKKRIKEIIESEYDSFARIQHPKLYKIYEQLTDLGYKVIGLPDLKIDPFNNVYKNINYNFGYCNVLPGLHNSYPAVYYLPWGIKAMDSYVDDILIKEGIKPIRVSKSYTLANDLMMLFGGLRCACGSV